MKKFVFLPKKIFKKGYAAYSNKAQFHGILWSDIIKISIVSIRIVWAMYCYLKFVNLSWTRGFFLKQANNELDVAKFNYEILKIKLLEHEKESWDKLNFPTKENPMETIEISKKTSTQNDNTTNIKEIKV